MTLIAFRRLKISLRSCIISLYIYMLFIYVLRRLFVYIDRLCIYKFFSVLKSIYLLFMFFIKI